MNIKNIVGFSVGPIGLAFLGLISVPMLTWMYPAEDIGRLNILQMVCSFGMMVFSLGLDQAYIREYHSSKNRNGLFLICFAPVVFACGCLIPVFIIYGQELSSYLFKSNSNRLLLPVVVAVFSTVALRFFTTILRMRNQSWLFSFCQMLNRIVFIVSCVVTYFFVNAQDFVVLAYMFALGLFIAACLAAWLVRKSLMDSAHCKIIFKHITLLLRFSLPLVVAGFFYWGLNATGTLMLSKYSTLAELGVYSVAFSIGGAATIFQQIFTVVWAPTVYKWVEQGVEVSKFENIMADVLAVVALLFCMVGVFSWTLDYFLPSQYAAIKFYVLCAIVPPIFYTLTEISAIGIGIVKKTWLSVLATACALVVSVSLNYVLVPLYGAGGALVSAVLAFTIFLVMKTELAIWVWLPIARFKLYASVLFFACVAITSIAVSNEWGKLIPLIWLVNLLFSTLVYWKNYKKMTLALLSKFRASI